MVDADRLVRELEGGKMTLNEYQDSLDKYYKVRLHDSLQYLVTGLASEAGEVAGKYAKCLRDKEGWLDAEVRIAMAYELGDVMFMVTKLAEFLGFSLQTIAEMNLKKLDDRLARGVIGGSGDQR